MSKNEKDQGNSKYPSKLLKLREWLTVPEAAQHLSNLLGEEVAEADVLRLGLEGQMQLSINFVKETKAYQGERFILFEEWEKEFRRTCSWEILEATLSFDYSGDQIVNFYFPGNYLVLNHYDFQINLKETGNHITSDELKRKYEKTFSQKELSLFVSMAVDDLVALFKKKSEKYGEKVLPRFNFSTMAETIWGVWDLAMLGNEKTIVENRYLKLTGGPKSSASYFYGNLVKKDDIIYRIHESIDVFELMYRPDLCELSMKALLEGSVFVVRTSALLDLQERLSEDHAESKQTNSLKPSEKKSLVKMVFAMAVDCYGYDPNDKKSPVTKDILKAAAQADTSICADTVRKWLDEGAKLRKDDF